MFQPTPEVGELVAVTRDVPEASVRRGETGMVLSADENLLRLCLDGDAHEVRVPRDAVLRLGPALAAARAEPDRTPVSKGGWFQFSWSRLLGIVLLMTVFGILPAYQLSKEQERMFSPPPPEQKVQQVPIRVRERSPGRIERPPPLKQPPEATP